MRYYLKKNDLYLCFDKRWTNKLIWAVGFPDIEMASKYQEVKGGEIVSMEDEEITPLVVAEATPEVRVALQAYGDYLKRMN